MVKIRQILFAGVLPSCPLFHYMYLLSLCYLPSAEGLGLVEPRACVVMGGGRPERLKSNDARSGGGEGPRKLDRP